MKTHVKHLVSLMLVFIMCSGLLDAAAEHNTELMQALNGMIERRELDALVSDKTRESVKQLEHCQLETVFWRCLKYQKTLEKFASLSAAPKQYQSFWEMETFVSEYVNKKQCAYPVVLKELMWHEQQKPEKKNNPDRQKALTLLRLLHDRCMISFMTSIKNAVDALPEKSSEAASAYVLGQKTKIEAVCTMLQQIEDEVWEFKTQPDVGYFRKQ